MERRWLRAGVVLLVLLTIFHVVKAVHQEGRPGTSDFKTYYRAALELRQGHDAYSPRAGDNDFIYPPFFAVLFSPLTFLPRPVAAALWALAQGGLWWAAVILSVRVARGPPAGALVLLLPSLLSVRYIANNWGHGQVNLLLMVLVLAALDLVRGGREVRGGLLLGAAVMVKVVPALFGLPFLLARRWRFLGSMALGVLLCAGATSLLEGPGEVLETHRRWLEMFGSHAGGLGMYNESKNQSAFALCMRLLTPMQATPYASFGDFKINLLALEPAVVARIFLGMCLVMLGALCVLCRRAPLSPASLALVYASIPLFSKVAMEHHFVILVFLFTVSLAGAREEGRFPWAVVVAGILVNVYNPWFLGKDASRMIQSYGPATMAVCVMWLDAARQLWRQSAPDSEPGS